MNNYYNHKIMIALPGGPEIELYRGKHTFHWKVWRFVTDGLSDQWEKWVEYTTPEKWLVGNRIVIARTNKGKVTLHPTAEERLSHGND